MTGHHLTDLSSAADVGRRAALRESYVGRVNRVLDHVERHLADDLSLAALADVAGFSRYHFHRVFSSIVGETPADFISRIRVERAAAMLLVQPGTPITEIANSCGFSGSAPFARAFRATFGMSATAWRAGGHRAWMASKQVHAGETCPAADSGREGGGALAQWGSRPAPRGGGDDRFTVLSAGLDPVTRGPVWRLRFLDREEPVTVTLERFAPMHIAYLRYVGRYQGDGALFTRLFGTLRRWAAPRGLLADERAWWTCVYHDPTVTADDRLRVTVGLTVPPGTTTSGKIASMRVDGGRYAVGRFALRANEYAAAWDAMMVGWLPESGCSLDDRHCFERFPLVANGGENCGVTEVEICLPVTPS